MVRNKKSLVYLSSITIALLLSLLAIKQHQEGITHLKNLYIERNTHKYQSIATDLEMRFKYFYQALRTMAMLPGVRKIDRYGKNFSADAKSTFQQIYNNSYQNVGMSEIYILPSKLNPHKIDPETGKPEAPILTFDEFIVGNSKVKTDEHHEEEELEEVEIYEYELMQKQLAFLKENYPTLSSINELDFPAIMGPPVITCDNSEFSRKDLEKGHNFPREGLIYTLPFYNMQEVFQGGVSGVLRTKVLADSIPKSFVGLVNKNYQISLITDPDPAWTNSSSFFTLGQTNSKLIYSQIFTLNIKDTQKWELWTALPNDHFWSHRDVKRERFLLILSLVFILFCSVLLCYIFVVNINKKQELERLIQIRTKQLEKEKNNLRQSYETIKNQQKQLEASSRLSSLGVMSAGIAHEVNNPLAALSGLLELSRKKLTRPNAKFEDTLPLFDRMEKTVDRIATIVRGLRAFSRDGKNDPFEPLSLNQIIDDSISLCGDHLKTSRVEIKKALPLEDIVFDGRYTQLTQVLVILINNAIDEIKDKFETPWIEIAATVDDLLLTLTFTDCGGGIPPEGQKHLFTPFFTTKEIGKGTGLGLSIAHGIAHSHQGELSYNEKSPHTQFALTLPLKQKQNT